MSGTWAEKEKGRDEPSALPPAQSQSPPKLEMCLNGRWDRCLLFLSLTFEKSRCFLSRAWVIGLLSAALGKSLPVKAPVHTCDPRSTHNDPTHSSLPCTGVSRAPLNMTTCTVSLCVYPTLSTGTYPCSLCHSLAPRGPLARWQSPIHDCAGHRPRERLQTYRARKELSRQRSPL